MEWTNAAITLGTSFFVMVTAIAVGVAVPYIQLRRELERERRQRRREVRSEPLLRLREVVAQTANVHLWYFMALRDSIRHPQNKLLEQNASEAGKKCDDYFAEGNWLRTVYTVTYPELQSEFKKVWAYWIQIHAMFAEYRKSRSDIDTDTFNKLDDAIGKLNIAIEEGILRIQSLINKRLEE